MMIGDSPHPKVQSTKAQSKGYHKPKQLYIQLGVRGGEEGLLRPKSLKSGRNVTHNEDPSSHS